MVGLGHRNRRDDERRGADNGRNSRGQPCWHPEQSHVGHFSISIVAAANHLGFDVGVS
jgi:hypothetical protein